QPPEAAASLAWRTGGRLHRVLPRFGLAVLELPAGVDAPQAEFALSSAPEVEFVEPDWIVYPARLPPDTRYADQWHHPLIRSPEAWDVATGSRSTVIAVIDSGVDLDHPDLAPQIYTNAGETPNNGLDDDGNGFVDDVRGWDFDSGNNNPSPSPNGRDEDGDGDIDGQVTHGTLVAGLAAASSSSFGTVGVSWKAQILPIQVFPDDGGTPASVVIEGIDYAILMGADVANLSLGVPAYVASFTKPVQRCHEAGITVVAAAGNGGTPFTGGSSTWFSPACNDGPNLGVDNFVLGVAATDQSDRRASFSNWDESGYRFVDVSAPGLAVFGPGYQNDAFPAFKAFFAKGNGTSFSSPIVAGLAALVKSREPGLTNDQIIQRIRETADNIDRANPGYVGMLGTGRINAARALGVDLPPAPVENLTAEDTAGDQGGSITLRWLRSTDDPNGAGDVTEYVVKRSEEAEGPFDELTTLAAGRDTYTDRPVENHEDYFYLVTTRDAGGQTADSEVAGPVSARDDTPPPVVTEVGATDEPDDSGGAVRVTWEAYAAPGDFAGFRIYRAAFNFITVAGMTPLATVTEPDATAYVDAATSDGVDYWYAVTAVDGEPNELQDVQAAGPVQSFPNQGIAITAGLHFLATPIVPGDPDPAAFFGIAPEALTYVRYDPAAQAGQGQYIYYQMAPTSPLMLLGLGRGFWFRAEERIVVNPTGNIAPSGPFGIDLEPGWRQIGNPFLAPIDFTAATVEQGSLALDLASAETAGIMRRTAWAYNSGANDYELIDRVVGGSPRRMAPWEGVWVLVMQPCRLVFDRDAGTSAADAIATQPNRPDWQVQLIARSGAGADAANYIGVAAQPERLAVASPPAFASGVRLELSGRGGPQAAVFRKPTAGRLQWRFTVTTDAAGDVTVATPDLSSVPPEYSVVLTDLGTGRQTQLRTVASYRYTADGPGERRFDLTVKPNTAALMVSSLTATPTRLGGAEVRFRLTADASCDVEVLNVAGRPVRRLATAKDYVAGQQVIVWNGRNENGLAAPNGTYLVRVRARSAAGSVVNALSRATILR
ncbi:MAG: hypothetical protein FJX74_15840, partial [Armatimonadetes bacterium]|nr:hypothetical protein [Armatimonadota bacterium]